MKVAEITKDEALTAVRAAAFTPYEEGACGHRGCEEHTAEGESIVHSFRGGFGADWSLANAEDAISTGRRVGWVDHWCGHNLVVQLADGGLVWFDVKRPIGGAE